jgi:hypothetical protein
MLQALVDATLSEWLKTTVPGIILLGAVCSIFALVITKLLWLVWRGLVHIFTTILPRQAVLIGQWLRRLREKVIYEFGYEMGSLSAGSPRLETAFYAYLISRLVASLAVFVFCGLLSAGIIIFAEDGRLTLASYLLLILALVAAYRSLRHCIAIRLSLY